MSAQTAAPPQFRSTVELITLDVAAVDEAGQAVAGLTREDFVLEVDGEAQPIVNFETVSVPAAAEAAATDAPLVATSAAIRRPGRAFALVADDLRLPGEQSLHLRRAIADFPDHKSVGAHA